MAMPEVVRGTTHSAAPIPADPSVLTTKQLLREVEILYSVIDDKVESRQREQVQMKELLQNEIIAMKDLFKEQLMAIRSQLEIIERQRVEQKKDTKDAVDAALIAQKEAVQEQTISSGLAIAKSEAATAKQLEGLSMAFSTAITGVNQTLADLKDSWNSNISDIKDRVGKIESLKQGAVEQRQTTQSNVSLIYGMGGFILAVIGTLIALAATGVFSR